MVESPSWGKISQHPRRTFAPGGVTCLRESTKGRDNRATTQVKGFEPRNTHHLVGRPLFIERKTEFHINRIGELCEPDGVKTVALYQKELQELGRTSAIPEMVCERQV